MESLGWAELGLASPPAHHSFRHAHRPDEIPNRFARLGDGSRAAGPVVASGIPRHAEAPAGCRHAVAGSVRPLLEGSPISLGPGDHLAAAPPAAGCAESSPSR